MKLREDVSAAKLRGGFYSPDALVDLCLDRVHALTQGRGELSLLEPSAGDGAFVRRLGNHPLVERVRSVAAVELLEAEAAKCRTALETLPGEHIAHQGSFIPWSLKVDPRFDIAVGNPPYVRYQFVAPLDKDLAPAIGDRLGLTLAGVSNLWIPVLLGALSCLRPHGAFAFIIPAEVFTGVSPRIVRDWLSLNVADLRTELFPAGSFPGVLQEVVILSGVRRAAPIAGPGQLEVVEHDPQGRKAARVLPLDPAAKTWTRYLLTASQIQAYEETAALPHVSELSKVAKFEVSIVTGANDYFSVDEETIAAYSLHAWTKPLLPRIRHATGLQYLPEDHESVVRQGLKANILHFAEDLPDPLEVPQTARYIAMGEAEGLPLRYKCSIREPWFRVPHVRTGELMLSKRSHYFPRVVLNRAGAYTTDTIYRGEMRKGYLKRIEEFVAGFHNSLTLLSSEIEGRSFGGGVLELVPSEVNRLQVPLVPGMGRHLARLDALLRETEDPDLSDRLVEETDRLLIQADIGFDRRLLDELRCARLLLMTRRLERN